MKLLVFPPGRKVFRIKLFHEFQLKIFQRTIRLNFFRLFHFLHSTAIVLSIFSVIFISTIIIIYCWWIKKFYLEVKQYLSSYREGSNRKILPWNYHVFDKRKFTRLRISKEYRSSIDDTALFLTANDQAFTDNKSFCIEENRFYQKIFWPIRIKEAQKMTMIKRINHLKLAEEKNIDIIPY